MACLKSTQLKVDQRGDSSRPALENDQFLGPSNPDPNIELSGHLLQTCQVQIALQMAVVVKTNGIPFWGFRCTTHFRTDFSGDWDVHWGYDLDFDPWPDLVKKTSLSVRVLVQFGGAASISDQN